MLDALAIRMSGNKHWRIDGHNIDWRGRSGSKFALAETARDLLHAIYVEDIVRVYRGRRSGQLEINAPTHDTPTGSFYTFTPIAKRTYQRLA